MPATTRRAATPLLLVACLLAGACASGGASRGELLDVEGFDELLDRAVESPGDDPMARQLQETMGEMFSEESVMKPGR